MKASFNSLQGVISLVAGLASIGGAVYSAMRFVNPDPGEVRAVVRSEKGDRPLPGSTIEVLTATDALVTTLTAGDDGSVRRVLREGVYRVRVSAPRFEPQTREVQVQSGAAAEVRFRLAIHQEEKPVSVAERGTTSTGARPVSRGVGAAASFFRRLGL